MLPNDVYYVALLLNAVVLTLVINASACTAFGVAASRSLSTAAVSHVMVFMLGAA